MQAVYAKNDSFGVRRGLFLLGASLGLGVGPVMSEAQQRPRPVIAVQCEADLSLCRELVQALSEMAPAYSYRINPSPLPAEAFEVLLTRTQAHHAQLRWEDGGIGAPVARGSLSETDFARQLVAASPDLYRVLQARQK